MMIKAISKTANIIVKIVLILGIALSVCFVAIKHGINIDEFSHEKFSFKGLYIKLDKKLILKAKNIEIYDSNDTKNSKKGYSAVELDKIINNFKYIREYFEEIDIESLKVASNEISAKYKDDIFFIDTPFLKIDTNLNKKGNEFLIAIDELSFKDVNITLAGNGKANLIDDSYSFDGFFAGYGIAGKLDFTLKDSIVKYEVSNSVATDLDDLIIWLMQIDQLDEEVARWIYGNVVAIEYMVDSLKGEFNIKSLDYYPDKLKGVAKANYVWVIFDKNSPPVIADSVDITLRDKTLYFDLTKPVFESKDLNGSKVKIDGFMDQHTNVYIDIKTNSLLDKDILSVIRNFGVDLPLLQKSGELMSDLLIKLDIKNDTTDISGNFTLKDSNIEISGVDFYSKSASIKLDNSKVTLKDANLKMGEIFNANNINGTIDTDKQKGNLSTNFSQINIPDIYNRKNLNSNVALDFSGKNSIIEVDKLGVRLNLAKNQNTINLPNISELVEYSKLLSDLGIKSGNVVVTTKDFKNFTLNAQDINFDMPFLLNEVPYSYDSFTINISPDIVSAKSLSGKLNFSVKNEVVDIDINGLDLVLSFKEDGKSSNFPKINFKGKNSHIIFKDIDKTLNLSSYSGNLYQKDINFSAKAIPKGDLLFRTNKNIVVLNGTNLIGESINNFLGTKSFSGGEFSIKAVGDSLNDFNAEILMKDTYLTDLIVYQRMLTFLNTIPSLASFKTPDFNKEGFTVKDGKIYFSKKGDNIHIQGMNFLGTSADIAGVGDIDLKTGALNIDLEIMYLKDASGLLENIPIINQIFLGRDRTFSTIIEIRGTVEKPVYSNKVAQDILMSPFNIIKNVLELPVSLFD